MTASQKLQIRSSEIRARLLAINGLEGDAYTDEIRSRVRHADNRVHRCRDTPPGRAGGRRRRDREARSRVPERFDTPEARELLALTGRANAGV